MPGASLPDLDRLDFETMKALVLSQQQRLFSRDSEIAHLLLLLDKYQRMLFGHKSEKVERQVEQLEFKLEELEVASAEQEAASPVPLETSPSARPSRRPLPEHLPREVQMHLPEHTCCPGCGGALREFGQDVAEMLEYVPESFKVVRHVRPKFCCKRCESVVEAPAPTRPIARGLAGPGLLAHVLVSKYCDHQPLYRQSEIYARQGVDLDRSTLASWVGATSQLLDPLIDQIRDHVLSAAKIHADDTPVPVLAPGHGRTRTGRLWTYVRDDRPAGTERAPAVWFAYSPDRRGEHPQQHLRHFKGTLQADAYAGFQDLYKDGRIREAACWAHARRKFHDILVATQSPIATEAVHRIGALYAIEKEIRGSTTAIRRSVRQAKAKPLLEELHIWLETTLRSLSSKSDMAGAIRYALARWPALTLYLEDGLIEIDNNAAERALRTVALGRKNYLFAGSNAGGERAAAIYSLIGSAKLNGLDPELYLRHVLTVMPDHAINRVTDLLPWNITLPKQHAVRIDP